LGFVVFGRVKVFLSGESGQMKVKEEDRRRAGALSIEFL